MKKLMGFVCILNVIMYVSFIIIGGPFSEWFTRGVCALIALNSFISAVENLTGIDK